MRIVQARLQAYRIPYTRTVKWSDTVEDSADYVLLTLTDDAGRSAVAEATVKPTWTGVSVGSLMAAVQDLFLPLVLDQTFESEAQLHVPIAQVPENSAAKALVGTACSQLFARESGRWSEEPIRVPLSWAVTRAAPAAMADEARQMVQRCGFGTLKIKGGQGLQTDVAAMRAIRSEVGAGVTLTVDANSAYGIDEAPRYVNAMAEAGANVVEDPASVQADAAMRSLVTEAPVPVLVDFPCAGAWHASALLAAGCRAINIKPGRYGLPESKRIAARCAAAGARNCVGLYGESALGTLINLQLLRDLPLLTAWLPSELAFFLTLRDQVLRDELVIESGRVTLPGASALLGMIDPGKVERFAL
jgi:L-alanine-DL-glutamate epimerase-like enolase superfamily enzyme